MTTPKKQEPWPGYLGYPTEGDFLDEVKRFLSTRKNNAGATENQIARVAKSSAFVRVKAEVDVDPSHTAGDRSLFTHLRRDMIIPTIKALHNQGYSVREIADALEISYSTSWYHCNKIRKHIRTREINPAYKLDESGKHFERVRMKRDQTAIAAERWLKAKAVAKRDRRAAKLAASAARTSGESA